VAEVVVLPGLAAGGGAGGDCLAVGEDLDRADVAGEVSGLCVGLGEGVRGDLRVVLGGGGVLVPGPGLQLNRVIGSWRCRAGWRWWSGPGGW
jgi:hypothetical protein